MRSNFFFFRILICCIFSFLIFIVLIQIFYFSKASLLNKCDNRQYVNIEQMPTIYFITPTYSRPVQKSELTRLGQTLLHIPKLHWILVEDSPKTTDLVSNFIDKIISRAADSIKLQITHLNAETPKEFKTKDTDPTWLKPRGVVQRNEALNWIRSNIDKIDKTGVVYFADDDNTYDIDLFEEIRKTKKVSCWPVGLVGGLMVERPLVENGRVYGFNSIWRSERLFPIDMAGFAINVSQILRHSNVKFSLNIPRGFQESFILKQILTGIDELEPRANNCSKVLVWHTRTEKPKLKRSKLKVLSELNIEV